jgi:hypothetical protein
LLRMQEKEKPGTRHGRFGLERNVSFMIVGNDRQPQVLAGSIQSGRPGSFLHPLNYRQGEHTKYMFKA